MYKHFPNLKKWQEIFLNYEGGFVRRGLLGQLLFYADSIVSIQVVYILLWSFLFLVVLYISYKKLSSVFDSFIVNFIFISPVIFLLPLTDRYVFGRRDLFIVIILILMAHICVACHSKVKPAIYKNTLYISLLFILGMLIHEMMIFYFPLLAIPLGAAYIRQNKTYQWVLITGFLVSIALFLNIAFSGDAETREIVFSSWAQRYPEMIDFGGLDMLYLSLSDNITGAFNHHMSWITFGSFITGLLLTAMPLLLLWQAYHPHAAIQRLISVSFILRLLFWPSVLAPLIVLLINTDYARFISFALITYLLFLYIVFSIYPQAPVSWLLEFKEIIFNSSNLRYMMYFLAAVYMLSWRMVHWAPSGDSYIKPGVLFYLYKFRELFL
jgi:hypothetical protein